MNVNFTYLEADRYNQTHVAKREIGDLKKRYQQKMLRKKVPKPVWDYVFVHQAEVFSKISHGTTGRTGIE